MNADIAASSFGELLRQHRRASGITQEALAERARLSVETISALERGARQKPYIDTIALLADALGLSVEDRADLERVATRRITRQAPANNLPAQISSFVGREHDLTKVGQILSAHRLITLVGPGGVGKTRLALRAAEISEAKRDGQWFIDLSPISNESRVVGAIAAEIGLHENSTLDGLIDFLRSKVLLLILDNCEHLVESVALTVDALLHACPNVTILATSREPLSTEGERVYRVPPLDPNDAVELFAERAEAADSDFDLTDSVKQVAARICEFLDGIALGIELVAARTAVASLETIAAEVHEHLHSSPGQRRTLVSRQQTMEALFDWSYGLLDDREKRVFRRLAIFVGGFSRKLAIAVCSGTEDTKGGVADALESLATKSLVQCEMQAEDVRYRLLEPTRQYAGEKLRERAEQQAVSRAHALALLGLAERFDSLLELTPDRVWDAVIEPERENFRAAIEWALRPTGDAEIAQRLAGSRCAMSSQFASGEARHWIHLALLGCSSATPPEIRANLEIAAARVSVELQGGGEILVVAAERALHVQPAYDLRGIAMSKYLLGLGLFQIGRVPEAEAALQDALATARRGGDDYVVLPTTAMLGAVRLSVDDVDGAREFARESLRLVRAFGAERLAVPYTEILAEIEFASGDAEAALQLAREAIAFNRARGYRTSAAHSLTNSAAYLVALGRYDEARDYARDGLELGRGAGKLRTTTWSLQHLAAVAALRDGPIEMKRSSARILGFVDEQLDRNGFVRQSTECREYDKLLAALSEALAGEELESLRAAGATLSEDRAVAEALLI